MAYEITYSLSKMELGANVTLTPAEARDYAQEKIENALGVFDTHKNITGTVVMKTEGVDGRIVQKIDITLNILGQTVRQSAHSRSMKRAIDKAIEPLERQIRKLKTQKVDKPRAEKKPRGGYAPSLE